MKRRNFFHFSLHNFGLKYKKYSPFKFKDKKEFVYEDSIYMAARKTQLYLPTNAVIIIL